MISRRHSRKLHVETLESRLLLTTAMFEEGEVSAADVAGNTFSSALELGTLNGTMEIQDAVHRSDRRDFFRFRLSSPAEVHVQLDQLSADIDLYLYDSQRRLMSRSTLGGSRSERIDGALAAGTYYALVAPYRRASSDYRLVLDVDAEETAPPDAAGNSFDAARDLGQLDADGGAQAYEDFVGTVDAADYYRFELTAESNTVIGLSQLSQDVDLYLYNSSRQLVASSTRSGAAAESLDQSLASGVYYVLVQPYLQAESEYAFSVTATTVETEPPPPMGDTLPDVPYLGGANEWNVNAVNAPEAWAAEYFGQGVVVAVVDTGVDRNHVDLQGSIWRNTAEVPNDGFDNDGNGYVDDVYGWNFANNNNDTLDGNGHGTHVAGTIAGSHNAFGVYGIAPGATIMPVQVLGSNGSGSSLGVANGIRYAVDNGADVINLSLGGGFSSAIRAAVQYAESQGVFVVAAAGNGGASVPGYPALHSAEFAMLSVGAHDSQNRLAGFSNRVGNTAAVQVDAPGVSVLSTYPGNRYVRLSGTSMATPHVSGVAALVLSANPNLSPAQLRAALTGGANRSVIGSDSIGGINAAVSIPLALGVGGGAGFQAAPADAVGSTGFTVRLFAVAQPERTVNDLPAPIAITYSASVPPGSGDDGGPDPFVTTLAEIGQSSGRWSLSKGNIVSRASVPAIARHEAMDAVFDTASDELFESNQLESLLDDLLLS